MSPSGLHIILPDFPVPTPRVRPTQPPKVDKVGPSSNCRSSCKNNLVPNSALEAQFLQVIEANTITNQISGVAQEYRHLVKGADKLFGNYPLQMNLGNYPRVLEL